jgi:ABC-type dipeptide/oligopeptide/nickel transport system permease component
MLQHLAPGDPTYLVTGPVVTDEVYQRTRTQLGLDEPLPVQYWTFLSNAVRGDLGTSLLSKRPTLDLIVDRLPKTLAVSLGAMALSYLIGVTAGVIAAVKRGTVWDVLVMGGATLGMAIPGFWLGLMLIMFFAVRLGWLPASGASTPSHFVLPILALGVGESASIARVIRSSMLESMGGDYIRTARAKGLRERVVVVRHALRNALLPVTSILGMQIGFLLTGAVIVETVFGFPGLGRLLIDSILNKDFPVVQGVLLVIGLMIVLGNFVADVIYRFVDPRIEFD